MYEKKKVTIVLLVAIALVVCLIFAIIKPIMHFPFETVWINFKSADGITRIQLTDKEAQTVRRMLNGKIYDFDLYFTGAGCGYGPDQTIEIGGTVYYVSQDSCGVVQKANTNYFYDLSNKEWDTLWAIFEAHGAKHQ